MRAYEMLSNESATTPVSDELQMLVFNLGVRNFALPLSQVSYIAKMPTGFRSRGADVERHFVFEGSPIAYISLWDALGLKSAYVEYEEIQEMLPLRLQDHVDWMAALEDSIRTGVPFTKSRNPHECAFGKWFYGYHTENRRLSLLIKQFKQPHAAIHALADKLLGIGQGEEAMIAFREAKNSTFSQLRTLFDSTQRLVVELQRRIVIILSDGDRTCAFGADGISDIIPVPQDSVKGNTWKTAGLESRATSGLIVLDDRTVVPMLDWHSFGVE